MAPRPRDGHQYGRKFLSKAFRHDTLECQRPAVSQRQQQAQTSVFQFEWKGLTMQQQQRSSSGQSTSAPHHTHNGGAVSAVQLTLFDTASQQFFGATHRIEADSLRVPSSAPPSQQRAPVPPVMIMMWSHTDSVVLCVEALAPSTSATSPPSLIREAAENHNSDHHNNNSECVVGWWFCALSSLTVVSELDLVPGSSALMYLSKTCWPAVPRDPSGAPIARAKFFFSAVEMPQGSLSLISSVLPAGVFAPMKDILRGPGFQANALNFRCGVSAFQLDLVLEDMPQGRTARSDGEEGSVGWASEVASLFSASPTDGVVWDAICCAHSGYKPTAPTGLQFQLHQSSPTRVESVQRGGGEGSNGDTYGGGVQATTAAAAAASCLVELSDLPNVTLLHAVFAVRFKRATEATYRIAGYAVIPLSGERDVDAQFDHVPLMRGPFTCEDPRMSSLEKSSPFARLPLRLSVTVKYFGTPVPARRIEEVIENRAHRPDPQEVGALLAGGDHRPRPALSEMAASKPPPGAVDIAPAVHPTHQKDTSLPGAPLVGQQPPISSPSPTPTPQEPQQQQQQITPSGQQQPIREVVYVPSQQPVPMVQAAAPQPDVAAHKMLCKILQELDQLRVQNEKLSSKFSSSSLALGPRRSAAGGAEGTGNLPATSGGDAFDIIDLAPRRCGVSLATRSVMLEGVQPILHPVHGTPVSDGMLSQGELPFSILGMRLEGITVDTDRLLTPSGGASSEVSSTGTTVPHRLVGFMSFGSLPMQVLAVLHLTLVAQDGAFQSYRISSGPPGASSSTTRGGGGGYVWHEPPFTVQDDLMLRLKSQGNLHLHFYDAVSMFYQFTATISLGMFERPLEAAASLSPLDISLLMDYSLTEKTVPANVLPVVYNIGQLHATLFSIGTQATRLSSAPSSSPPPQQNGGAVRNSSSNVVVARRITDGDGVCNTTPPQQQQQQHGPLTSALINGQQQPQMTQDPKQNLHRMRADYVKNLLIKNGGAVPGVPQHHELRREGVEMEYRLRFVEKKRDASKADRIAEVLKQRVTTAHAVTVAGGRTEVYQLLFESPLPVTSLFAISVDDPYSKPHLKIGSTSSSHGARLVGDPPATSSSPLLSNNSTNATNHGVGAATFLLGPRERIAIPLLIHCGSDMGASSQSPPPLEVVIKGADRGETMMIANIHVTFVPPTVDRRFEVFGAPGAEIRKRLFLRRFPAASIPITGLGGAAAAENISNLCTYCTVSDATTTAESKAVIDPITQSAVVAWEEIIVQTMIPVSGAKLVYLNIYRDAAMTKHFETWELTVFPCQVVSATSIMFGRTTSIALPVASDKVYVNDPSIVAVVPSAAPGEPSKLRFKPREAGSGQTLLHVQRDGKTLDKVLLVTQTAFPTPTYQYAVELSAAEAQLPLLRRFLFSNREQTQRVLTVQTNYRHQVRVTPNVFALGPGDSQHLALEVVGLSLMEGQSEGNWPIWIFINDEEDGTVESYFLNVMVRLHRPFY